MNLVWFYLFYFKFHEFMCNESDEFDWFRPAINSNLKFNIPHACNLIQLHDWHSNTEESVHYYIGKWHNDLTLLLQWFCCTSRSPHGRISKFLFQTSDTEHLKLVYKWNVFSQTQDVWHLQHVPYSIKNIHQSFQQGSLRLTYTQYNMAHHTMRWLYQWSW